jgi:hypothetical protein
MIESKSCYCRNIGSPSFYSDQIALDLDPNDGDAFKEADDGEDDFITKKKQVVLA